jgi:hypothetical protein
VWTGVFGHGGLLGGIVPHSGFEAAGRIAPRSDLKIAAGDAIFSRR